MSDHSLHTEKGFCNDDSDCNGGKCQLAEHGVQHKHCYCPDYYSGNRCERYCPLQCQNGGLCIVTPLGGVEDLVDDYYGYDEDEYTCKCFGHYFGPLCEIPYKVCGKAERCFNGGKCIYDRNDLKHKCKCRDGYGGDDCKTIVETPIVKKNDSSEITTILVLLFLLGAILTYLLKRKRSANIPDFVSLEQEAREKYLRTTSSFSTDMPCGSYSDHGGKDVSVNMMI